jgi:glycosyltransferase involved in cell wall biosynthesis
MVSIIITAYNYERYIERAIRSCLDQSISNDQYEIIVVNDCSSDNTSKILENYKNEARIFGIKKALGQFVVFLDADDYIQRDLLLIQRTFLAENNSLDAVSTDYFLVDERGNHLEHVNAEVKSIACGIMFRKDLLFDIGLYDESFMAREEEDLRIRFLKKHSIYNIILPLYRYRMHENNLTKNFDKMDEFEERLKNKHNPKD